MEKFKALLEKKKSEGGSISPMHVAANTSVLKHLMDDMDGLGAAKVKGIKKVSISADDDQGMKSALGTTKKILDEQDASEAPSGNEEEGKMEDDSQDPQFDDQDAEGPNHIPTLKESMNGDSEDADEPLNDEGTELAESDEDPVSKLQKENEMLKAHIAHLQKPKAHY